MRKVREKKKKEKQYQGKKCPFCHSHLQERDELVDGIIFGAIECIDCGEYSRVKGN